MPAMAVPLAAERLDLWEDWVAELTGPRKAAFDDMNARHGLTDHRAYLQPMPDGSYLVLVIHEGPGGADFLANLAQSDHEFDQWFMGAVVTAHDLELGSPPPSASRKL